MNSYQLRVMEIGVNALTATFGTQYTYGSFATALCNIYILLNQHSLVFATCIYIRICKDVGAGVTTDYYYITQGILHSYTIELRDIVRDLGT